MIGTLLNVCLWAGVALAACLLIWWIVSKTSWGTSLSTTGIGQALDAVLDTSQAVSAYASLTAIRQLDSVEADPKAIEACNYLRSVVTAWPKKEEVKPVVATVPVETADGKIVQVAVADPVVVSVTAEVKK